MADIDRRTLVRGVLGCAAFVTVASVSIVTPEILKAVPLSAGNTGSLEADEKVETDDVVDIEGLIDVDDALPESAQRVQYWRVAVVPGGGVVIPGGGVVVAWCVIGAEGAACAAGVGSVHMMR